MSETVILIVFSVAFISLGGMFYKALKPSKNNTVSDTIEEKRMKNKIKQKEMDDQMEKDEKEYEEMRKRCKKRMRKYQIDRYKD